MRRATSSSRVSPALCPRVSLTSLKPSRSSSIRPSGCFAVMPSSSDFSTARRLGRPGEVVGLGELERDARLPGLPQRDGEAGTGGQQGDGGRDPIAQPSRPSGRISSRMMATTKERDEEAAGQSPGHAHLRRPREARGSDDEHEGRAPHHGEDRGEAVGARRQVEDEARVGDGEQDEAEDERDRAPRPLPGGQRPLADDDEGQDDGRAAGTGSRPGGGRPPSGKFLANGRQQQPAGHGADAADHDRGVEPGRLARACCGCVASRTTNAAKPTYEARKKPLARAQGTWSLDAGTPALSTAEPTAHRMTPMARATRARRRLRPDDGAMMSRTTRTDEEQQQADDEHDGRRRSLSGGAAKSAAMPPRRR